MSYTDGDFTIPGQNGAKQGSLLLQAEGDYYAVEFLRQYKALAQYYDPVLRVRNSFTQHLLYSDDQSQWTQTNVVATANYATDPEGGTAASIVGETTANGAHGIQRAMTISAGACSFGVMMKAAGRNHVRLRVNNAADGDAAYATFDISNGVTTASTGNSGIRRMFSNWWWGYIQGTPSTQNSTAILELSTDGASWSYAGTEGSGIQTFRGTAVASISTPFPAIYSTASTRSVSAPVVDNDDPLCFLVEETAPGDSGLEFGIAEWARFYTRVPRETNPPSSVIVSKPEPPGSGTQRESGGIFFDQPDTSDDRWDIYRSNDVSGDSGLPSFYPSAGTYFLSFKSSTSTALVYSATSGAVESALNALAPVSALGGVTVTGTYQTQFDVTFTALTSLTVDISSLTVTSGFTLASSVNSFSNGYSQSVYIAPFITGGTFTISIFGQTTSALSYQATLAQIESALNALSNVSAKGGCTVSGFYSPNAWFGTAGGTNNDMKFTVEFSTEQIIGDAGLLTPAPATIYTFGSGGTQIIRFSSGSSQRTVYAPDHGVSSGGVLFLRSGTGTGVVYYTGVTYYTVLDDNLIRLFPTTGLSWANITPLTKIGERMLEGYQAGPVNLRCKRVSNYYLPGVSPGVDTEDDIPIPEQQTDPQAFFDAVIDPDTTDVNWDVGTVEVWRGPIVRQTTIKVLRVDLVP